MSEKKYLNPYELLYMYEKQDPDALRLLIGQYRPLLMKIVISVTGRGPFFDCNKDDFRQEMDLMILHAANTYRNDRNCSFKQYLTTIASRRAWRMNTIYRNMQRYPALGEDDMIAENADLYHPASAQQGMMDPEYVYRFNLARENLEALLISMKEKDREIMEAWKNGGTYEASSRKLGISYKAFDGRLQRVKKITRAYLKEH
ncbi:MAG: hypothetical protein K6D03_05725 [Solobacterium sp.]|nr:hypothetical protein [Solobacterium sp.]